MSCTIHIKHIRWFSQASFLLLLICSCSQEKVLTIGTGSTAGNYDRTGLAIARAVANEQKAQGLRLDVRPSSGSVANIDAILAGGMEFGIAQADRQYQAVKGLAEWKGKGPQKDLRAVLSLYTESVTLVAGGDTGINSVHDLKGKRVDIGPPGSGIRQNAIDALEIAGIAWQKDLAVHEESLDDRARMLMSGQLDALFHTVGHPSKDILFLTFSMRPVRFIGLADVDELLARYPYYSRSIIPVKKWYPQAANDKDVETVGVRATLVTSARVPDELVYAVTKAVFNNLEVLAQHDPVLRSLSKSDALQGLTAPIHPGALTYYREIGLQVPPSNP